MESKNSKNTSCGDIKNKDIAKLFGASCLRGEKIGVREQQTGLFLVLILSAKQFEISSFL